ncbi:replicative DNA helicase [Actinomadura sp. NPDC049382]|uniref:replicative DNA helicase n=1 Tax=Actinomadura sp. NPDC049382 TaxID=3158220 RepID=UPI00341B3F83
MTHDDEGGFEQLPPNDIEAEACALGAAMLSPDAAGQVAEMLRVDDFFRPAHQIIFRALLATYGRGEPVNPVTVRAELPRQADGPEHVPDGMYLHRLVEQVPMVNAVGSYITQVRNVAKLRGLAVAGPRITQLAYASAAADADDAADIANKLLDEATATSTPSVARSVADMAMPFMESLEAGGDQRGVASGWTDLGRLVPRFRPGQLITIAARPGVGKSVAMACIAHYVGVKLGLPVFVGTLEMSTDEFMARLVSHDAKVNLKHLLEPELLTEDDWERLARSLDRLQSAKTLVIDDTPAMGIPHVRASLRQMRRTGSPAALTVIDYLQLMESPKKVESRQVEVSQYSRGFKLLAKEFEVPIIVGSQLNRDVERRADKKPILADLRESGSVEQDSDIVIMLNRDDVYDPESPRAGEIDMYVEKNRNGPKGLATLAFQGHYSRIDDMAARDNWTPHGVVS